MIRQVWQSLMRALATWWQWMRTRQWGHIARDVRHRDMPAMRGHVQAVPRQIWIVSGVLFTCLACGMCSYAVGATPTPGATTNARAPHMTPMASQGTQRTTPAPTTRPTATRAPTATTVPPTATLADLPVTLVAAVVTNHQPSHITIRTAPGAQASITVTYCSGRDARGGNIQDTLTANASGYVTWAWTPETTCPGHASGLVIATLGDQSGSLNFDFTVAG